VRDLSHEKDNDVPYGDRMNVINKESNRNAPFIWISALLFAHQFMVELDQKQSLILHCCE
jgi:hypothetical protein